MSTGTASGTLNLSNKTTLLQRTPVEDLTQDLPVAIDEADGQDAQSLRPVPDEICRARVSSPRTAVRRC